MNVENLSRSDPNGAASIRVSDISHTRQDQLRFYQAWLGPLLGLLPLIFSILTGIIVRLHLLTRTDLSVDEAASVMFAQLRWDVFLRNMRSYEANMSFYYLLLRYWVHFGDSVAVIRGLSVLFGIAAILSIYLIGTRLFGKNAGLAAAALSSVNAFQVSYSREARGYSLAVLLATVSTYYLVRAMEQPRQKRYWFVYAVMSTLGVYTHIFFYLVITAQWLSVGYILLRRYFKDIVWTGVLFVLLTTPMTWFVLTKNQGQLNWVPRPTFLSLLEFAKLLTGYGGSILLATYAMFCLVALVAAHRVPKNQSNELVDERRRVNLVVWWLVFPIASTVLISFWRPIFYDRFLLISAPAVVLLAGKGMVDLSQSFPRIRALFPASLLFVASLSLWGIQRYDATLFSQDDNWLLATDYVLARQQPGDAVFFYRASGSRPFTYYADREIKVHERDHSPLIIFPIDVNNSQMFNVEPSMEEVTSLLHGHSDIWLILQHYQGLRQRERAKQTIESALRSASYHVSQEKTFPEGIEVFRYVQASEVQGEKYNPRANQVAAN